MKLDQEIFKKYNVGEVEVELDYEYINDTDIYLYFNDKDYLNNILVYINKDNRICIKKGMNMKEYKPYINYDLGVCFFISFKQGNMKLLYNNEYIYVRKTHLLKVFRDILGFTFNGGFVTSEKYNLPDNGEIITRYTKKDFEAI